jgi:hypothetical protein
MCIMQTDLDTLGPRDLVHALRAIVIDGDRHVLRQVICPVDDTISAIEQLLAEDVMSIHILGRSIRLNHAKKLLAVDYAQFIATLGDAPPFRPQSDGRLRALLALKPRARFLDPLVYYTRNTTEATIRIATLLVDDRHTSVQIIARNSDVRSVYEASMTFFMDAFERDETATDESVINTN